VLAINSCKTANLRVTGNVKETALDATGNADVTPSLANKHYINNGKLGSKVSDWYACNFPK